MPVGVGEGIAPRWRDPEGRWCGFAARARVIALSMESPVINSPPSSLNDLADQELRGRVAMADPRFGTTGSHLAIIRSRIGADQYRQLLEDLRANDVQVVSSNSSSRDRVLSGEAWVGLTDTDDIEVVRRRGASLGEGFLREDGVLLLPNVIAIVKGCPNPQEAQQLAHWLLEKTVEEKLAASSSRQVPLREGVPVVEGGLEISQLDPVFVDWNEAALQLPEAIREAERILLDP